MLVGVSDSRISQLVAEGVLVQGGTLREWLLAYCQRLREQAAGRASHGDLDLAQERAALARAQREGVELKNAALRGEYAPIGLLEDVLSTASSAIADQLDGLEGVLRRVAPELPEGARDAVQQAIARARNEWVRSTEALVLARLDAMAVPDDDAEVPPSA